MKKALLYRQPSSDQGTRGDFIALGFSCKTLELPWKGNAPNVSCIPVGIYFCTYRYSRKYGHHYLLHGVDGRTWILTHSGNLAGDKLKGFKTHSAGCILVGKYRGSIRRQLAVLYSKPTLRKLVAHFDRKPFELEIREAA